MSAGLYEIDISFHETGTGEAEIAVPQALGGDWQYVLVNGGAMKAIVRVQGDRGPADDAACRPLREEDLEEVRRSWPRPKVKEQYIGAGEDDGDAEEGAQLLDEPGLTTLQTVRWGLYLIDVPVEATAADGKD